MSTLGMPLSERNRVSSAVLVAPMVAGPSGSSGLRRAAPFEVNGSRLALQFANGTTVSTCPGRVRKGLRLSDHLPRLGPDFLAQPMSSKPILQGFEADIVNLAVVLDGVALQRLGGIGMDVGHDVRGDLFQRSALDPGLRCLHGGD